MKINKNFEVPNERTELEKLLVTTLDDMEISLGQPKMDTLYDDFNFTRVAKSGDLEIVHRKSYDGKEAHEYLGILNTKYEKGKVGSIDIYFRGNKVSEIDDGGVKETEKHINTILKSMKQDKLRNYKDAVKFVKFAMNYFDHNQS
jgi:hypothetical protein